ncbi:MFS transporter [Agrococcus sp. ARC_14]|uniref:MFS transporter n=1 Tax=Agrococcus sp. ARC_14 TaxID=2919927 RepID=UPI001F06E535|nr:MFS transporter [Agrococcus sp. ARC_14]MCH1883900.1 MFS transporter [Agrococcus sp. ARC_14]
MNLVALAYLGSHFLSLLGNGIAAVALPLIVLQITGSPLSMGVISASTAVPAVLIGLLAGFVLDRWNRRNISVASDLISAASVAALPVVDMLWGLELWWFVALGILGSFGDVPGGTAREVLVAAVVRRSGVSLERLVGVRQTLTSAALVVGPALTGTLVALVGPSAVFFITAGTSAAAALLTLVIPREAGRVPKSDALAETPWRQVIGGFSVLRHSRFLVATIVLIVGLTTVGGGLQGLVLPLHFSMIARPELLGLVLTSMAGGMLAGALLFSAISTRLSRRAWLTMGFAALTVGYLALSTLASLPVIFISAGLVGVSNALLGAVLGVLQVEKTPERARGRVLALQNTALQLAAPLGIGGAGIVAELSSPVVAGLAVSAVWVLALLSVLATRSLHDLERDEAA